MNKINLAGAWTETMGPHATPKTERTAGIAFADYEPRTTGEAVINGCSTYVTDQGIPLTGTVNVAFTVQDRTLTANVQYPNGQGIEYTGEVSPCGREVRGMFESNGGEGPFIWRKQGADFNA